MSLIFTYGTMDCGKSANLIQLAYNYEQKGLFTLAFCPIIDDRYEIGTICSRIGLTRKAIPFDNEYNFHYFYKFVPKDTIVSCIFIDESQFLTERQVLQLKEISNDLTVRLYGLRTNFLGNLFLGSKIILSVADELIELPSVCWCGAKASMNLRINKDGSICSAGDEIKIGGNESYISVCYKHFLNKQSHK